MSKAPVSEGWGAAARTGAAVGTTEYRAMTGLWSEVAKAWQPAKAWQAALGRRCGREQRRTRSQYEGSRLGLYTVSTDRSTWARGRGQGTGPRPHKEALGGRGQ